MVTVRCDEVIVSHLERQRQFRCEQGSLSLGAWEGTQSAVLTPQLICWPAEHTVIRTAFRMFLQHHSGVHGPLYRL